ncbi:hypothetical protein HY620_02450 [Candidatus Uhrbacteria bacterium]|nr:hypothetical protein [Candidatus Uhrbacteria bacterium]
MKFERQKIAIVCAVGSIAILGSLAGHAQRDHVDGFLGYLFGKGVAYEAEIPKKQKPLIKKNVQKKCSFLSTEKKENHDVFFKEIAWMGDRESPNNEWFAFQKISPGPLDISGYQAVNENEKIRALVPEKTLLTDEKPFFVFGRKETISGVTPDATYAGALRNTKEGLRLFDTNCLVLDEVLALPSWPAGDLKAKTTMKRDMKTRAWYPQALTKPKTQKKSSQNKK